MRAVSDEGLVQSTPYDKSTIDEELVERTSAEKSATETVHSIVCSVLQSYLYSKDIIIV